LRTKLVERAAARFAQPGQILLVVDAVFEVP